MVTVRVHLDAVPCTNGPLLIAPGSHRRGRILLQKFKVSFANAESSPSLPTLEIFGYTLRLFFMRPEAAVAPLHRRVLQVDYASCQFPGGLEWLVI